MRSIRQSLLVLFGITICLILSLSPSGAQTPQRNDVNIVIAIDCSYSVNPAEFNLQIGGIAKALTDPEIISAISEVVTHWSTFEKQEISIPWTRISNLQDALRAATRVAISKRLTLEGGTSISGALRHGQVALETAPIAADRHVINLIADGENNNGERVEGVRDWTIANGTTVNAVAILNERHWLHYYLRNRVIGGAGAFVEQAADYVDFAQAFRKKLLREINGDLITMSPDQTVVFSRTRG